MTTPNITSYSSHNPNYYSFDNNITTNNNRQIGLAGHTNSHVSMHIQWSS